jgi:hypothetical protein
MAMSVFWNCICEMMSMPETVRAAMYKKGFDFYAHEPIFWPKV